MKFMSIYSTCTAKIKIRYNLPSKLRSNYWRNSRIYSGKRVNKYHYRYRSGHWCSTMLWQALPMSRRRDGNIRIFQRVPALIRIVVNMEFSVTSRIIHHVQTCKGYIFHKENLSPRHEANEPSDITFSPGRLISPCNDYGHWCQVIHARWSMPRVSRVAFENDDEKDSAV